METILKLLLIRFGIIAVIVVVLALIAFAVALQLRKRGRLTAVASRVTQVAGPLAETAINRSAQRGGLGAVVSRAAVDLVNEKIAEADQEHRPRDLR